MRAASLLLWPGKLHRLVSFAVLPHNLLIDITGPSQPASQPECCAELAWSVAEAEPARRTAMQGLPAPADTASIAQQAPSVASLEFV
jgi:hypothetical protein